MKKMTRDEILKERSNIVNKLANIEKKWQILENVSSQSFPLNWKKLSIKKVANLQPSLKTTINKCKEVLFTELALLNSQLDADEISQMVKDRYDKYLSKEQNLIKDSKIEFALATDSKVNGIEVPLDALLKAKSINRKKIAEIKHELEVTQVELELEALNLLKNL